jgi:hypothetical protein
MLGGKGGGARAAMVSLLMYGNTYGCGYMLKVWD